MTKKVSRVEKESIQMPENTESNKIWIEIKDKKISMFALPAQTVSEYCQPVNIDPTKLYLLSKASSFLPALEEALQNSFTVERVDKYIVVARKQ